MKKSLILDEDTKQMYDLRYDKENVSVHRSPLDNVWVEPDSLCAFLSIDENLEVFIGFENGIVEGIDYGELFGLYIALKTEFEVKNKQKIVKLDYPDEK